MTLTYRTLAQLRICKCGHAYELHIGHTQAFPITKIDTHCSQGCGCKEFQPDVRVAP